MRRSLRWPRRWSARRAPAGAAAPEVCPIRPSAAGAARSAGCPSAATYAANSGSPRRAWRSRAASRTASWCGRGRRGPPRRQPGGRTPAARCIASHPQSTSSAVRGSGRRRGRAGILDTNGRLSGFRASTGRPSVRGRRGPRCRADPAGSVSGVPVETQHPVLDRGGRTRGQRSRGRGWPAAARRAPRWRWTRHAPAPRPSRSRYTACRARGRIGGSGPSGQSAEPFAARTGAAAGTTATAGAITLPDASGHALRFADVRLCQRSGEGGASLDNRPTSASAALARVDALHTALTQIVLEGGDLAGIAGGGGPGPGATGCCSPPPTAASAPLPSRRPRAAAAPPPTCSTPPDGCG